MNVNPSMNAISLSNDFNITFGDWGNNNAGKISLHRSGDWIAYDAIDDGLWHYYCIKTIDSSSSTLQVYIDSNLVQPSVSNGFYYIFKFHILILV